MNEELYTKAELLDRIAELIAECVGRDRKIAELEAAGNDLEELVWVNFGNNEQTDAWHKALKGGEAV